MQSRKVAALVLGLLQTTLVGTAACSLDPHRRAGTGSAAASHRLEELPATHSTVREPSTPSSGPALPRARSQAFAQAGEPLHCHSSLEGHQATAEERGRSHARGNGRRHPEEAAVSMAFHPPLCHERQDGFFECDAVGGHARGLVPGFDYRMAMQVTNGNDLLFVCERALEVDVFLVTIPHLPMPPNAVRISILDGTRGVSREEGLLSTMIRPVELHARKSEVSGAWPLGEADPTSQNSNENSSHAHVKVQLDREQRTAMHVKAQMRHPEDASFAVLFFRPVCAETKEKTFECTTFECQAKGMVPGVDYLVTIEVKNGASVVFADEWVLDDGEGVFYAAIPRLSVVPSTIRISILDGFRGLTREESLLATMIRPVEVRRNLEHKGDEAKPDCRPTLLWPLPKIRLESIWETASGLRWRNIGTTRPTEGNELTSSTLSTILMTRRYLTAEEWGGLDMPAPRTDDFIKAGNFYFTPDDIGGHGSLASPANVSCRGTPIKRRVVTLSTVASIDRMSQVLTVAAHWDGPMSVALYARSRQEENVLHDLVFDRLSTWLEKRKEEVQIVMVPACSAQSADDADGDTLNFPINELRFHAVACAGTELVFYIDVDFVPSKNASGLIHKQLSAMDFSSDVLVVPCFKHNVELQQHLSWPPPVSFETNELSCTGDRGQHCINIRFRPLQMQDLLAYVKNGWLSVPGLNHGATDYYEWLEGAMKSVHSSYAVSYTLGWEPYIVVNKRLWKGLTQHGMFDRRFNKRGWDKASFVYEVATMGYTFRTLHGVFLAHATQRAIAECPPAFGSEFCKLAAQASRLSNGPGWRQTLNGIESGFILFASFISSLSQYHAGGQKNVTPAHDCGAGACTRYDQLGYLDNDRTRTMQSWCMIFPSQAIHKLSTKLIYMSLTNTYAAHEHAHTEARTKYGENWLVSGHWIDFANLWCASVPLLVGHLTKYDVGVGLVLHVDRRVWESYAGPQFFGKFRYYHFISVGHVHLSRRTLGPSDVILELISFNNTLRLQDACDRTAFQSSLWLCSIDTRVEDVAGNVILQLHRQAFLTTDLISHSHLTWIVVVSVSHGFVDMFENWLHWYQLLALDMRVVLIAEDAETFKTYQSRSDLTTQAGTFRNLSEALDYESTEYRHLVSNRAKYLINMVESYKHVIYTDVDTVWLEDPRVHFTGDYDLWMPLDEEIPTTFCTGFMALLPTRNTIETLQAWDLELANNPQLNQPLFNRLIKQNLANVGRLDRQLFPSGDLYFGEEGVRSEEPLWGSSDFRIFHRHTQVVWVHNNWIVGKEKKIQRFKNAGLWKNCTD